MDLLCLDSAGDTVVVELKKGRTPREVTAQALDYASWVKCLGFERIKDIASDYFKLDSSLEDAFKERFDQHLPETLNLNHRAVVVAESMDDSTERIVRYLSELNVPINVATVQHFRDKDGREMLAQVLLVEPEIAVARERSTSKGTARPSVETLQALAEENGIGNLYGRVRKGVSGILSARPASGHVGYNWKLDSGSTRAVLTIDAFPSEENGGLGFYVHASRLVNYLGIDLAELRAWLPYDIDDYDVNKWVFATNDDGKDPYGYTGAFRTESEIDKFIAGLRASVE